ncbi:MAG: VCBS repeat-containing protein [Planctomycetes bacterium]|nr:VCBS repeat-containing protein [Planctomycetota bacterium]
MLLRSLGIVLSLGVANAQVFSVTSLPSGAFTNGVVATGDVNGDGLVDLVVAELSSIKVYVGDGAGGFAAPTSLSTPVFFGQSCVIADGNGDGKADIWFAHGFGVALLPGDGAGAFASAIGVGGGGEFAIGDLDGDGDPDVVASVGSNTVVRLLNDGTGHFGAPSTVANSSLSLSLTSVRLADVDMDGDLDVVAHGAWPWLVVVRGDGLGGFAPPTFVATPGTMGPPTLADFDGDGYVDIAFRTGGATPPTPAQVWRNDGTGGFQFASILPLTNEGALSAADMDGDGHVDLVASTASAIVVLAGDGAFGFTTAATVGASSVGRPTLADVDRDGRMDILAVAALSSMLVVMRNSTAPPVGTAVFGAGTPTCSGTIGIAGNERPSVGAAGFRVQCTNAPPSTVGILGMGTSVPNGWDPLGIGLTFHLGLAVPVAVMPSDHCGAASAPLPIPDIPWLAGLTVHVQTFWAGDPGLGETCSPAAYELASSRGLTITVQP